MHLVHCDQNYIYNFWPREGESIAQDWGRHKLMLYSCPYHELSRETIIQNFYARLSRKDSCINLKFDCVKSFMDTDAFCEFSNKYGLDSMIVASFCESFATHVDLPKKSGLNIILPLT